MQIQRVDAGKGLAWFGEGWRMFTRDPGMWIVLTVVGAIVALVLGLIPLVGPMLLAMLIPGLTGGYLYAASESMSGRRIDVSQLFVALQQPEKRNPMLVLGAILLGFHILLMLIAVLLVGGSMGVMGMAGHSDNHALAAGAGVGLLLALLIISLIGLLVAMAFIYAIPLVMFTPSLPGEAIRSSLRACITNFLPLLVFSVIYLVLATLAAIPFMLGYLILMPVSFGAIFASYRDIYGNPSPIAP